MHRYCNFSNLVYLSVAYTILMREYAFSSASTFVKICVLLLNDIAIVEVYSFMLIMCKYIKLLYYCFDIIVFILGDKNFLSLLHRQINLCLFDARIFIYFVFLS